MEWSNKNERMQFLASFAALCETFGKECTEQLPKIYHRALQDFTVEQVKTAIGKAIMHGRFFPRPVELRELVQGRVETRAELEADKVLKAIAEYGAYNAVAFDDHVTAAVVWRGFGGWGLLCDSVREGEEKWFRKDFVRRYVAFAEEGITHAKALPGRRGTESVALVGDRKKALAVLERAEPKRLQ
ncbi:hypothetical protein ACI3L3_11865 [Desulfobaculum sp. SPO524]|uniref:hypothetical protein n=1 Tax=Desulfobaculum sp. SPO524 TaxID=3378071 RepID=UPI0038540940